ncbi:hypothetical protein [Zobellella aerophila]|uniref:AAA+ ATPase domain-containing protein n=1 Tax=Zobellella aerophila TaxID=870480 RepID=A0ABP6V5J1_9GAMM
MTINLTDDNQLKAVVTAIQPFERSKGWLDNLAAFLDEVRQADLDTRASQSFQQRLWENNPVSSVGMGTVDVSAALADPTFRRWLAEASLKPLPEGAEARLAWFQQLHDEIVKRLRSYGNRVARVKVFRVLAAFYPRYFSTITYGRMALECHRAWFGTARGKPGPVPRQLALMARLEQLLGPAEDSPRALAERMTLPWIVYEDHVQTVSTEVETETSTLQGKLELKPLPALQRRKGFTSIRGGMDTLFSALSFVVEGVSREELLDFLRAEFPDYRDSSLRTLLSIFKHEFYVIQEVDGLITQTARGELFLETEDPQELIPLFITRILGVDHVLCALKDGEKTTDELIRLLKQVNPGWTTNYAPGAMLKWLRDFDLLTPTDSNTHVLTDTGRYWAGQIHWTPEPLPRMVTPESEDKPSSAAALDINSLDLAALIGAVTDGTAFSKHQASQLHCGLWAHERRHFAILAGLSGSGKTLLAQRYGEALARQFGVSPEQHVFVQAVQPGWYDPSPLFGYINPLRPDNYVRSPLLDFLLAAANHPDQPFVVILDEMNLSHPEQYFAPVLSAMESGDRLRLHNEGDSFDGVPMTLAYPANVAFIGTVNMDETTQGISDKVLDRAFTLEFWDINLDDYPHWHRFSLAEDQLTQVRECLNGLLEALAQERLHFGWRTVEDVLSYLDKALRMPDSKLTESLDDVVYARILPKLRGTESNRLHRALDNTMKVLEQHDLTRSRAKVQSLKTDLTDTGMMRFWR